MGRITAMWQWRWRQAVGWQERGGDGETEGGVRLSVSLPALRRQGCGRGRWQWCWRWMQPAAEMLGWGWLGVVVAVATAAMVAVEAAVARAMTGGAVLYISYVSRAKSGLSQTAGAYCRADFVRLSSVLR